jgi:hypothetical protein
LLFYVLSCIPDGCGLHSFTTLRLPSYYHRNCNYFRTLPKRSVLTPLSLTFPDSLSILRDLTREILRNQPDDINKFSFEYFANKVKEQADAAEAAEE